jgi:hypothetical protein
LQPRSVANHFRLDEAMQGIDLSNRSLSGVTAAFNHRVLDLIPAPIMRHVTDGLIRPTIARDHGLFLRSLDHRRPEALNRLKHMREAIARKSNL